MRLESSTSQSAWRNSRVGIQGLDAALERGVRGQRVFVRSDLNVPLQNGIITDDSRIRASAETLRVLSEAGAKVIVASHLGRPKGKVDPASSLRPVAECLEQHLGRPVAFVDTCIGTAAQEAVSALPDGGVLLLENLRFHEGEEGNDPEFSRSLAELADIYVNDAFGTAHRAHASTRGMTAYLEDTFAGSLLLSELEQLNVVGTPERPLLCLLGGAKVSDKLAVLETLAPHSDVLAVGGAMAYTFLASQGQPTGQSRVEPDRLDDARRVLEAADAAGRRLLLPVDHVVVEEIHPDAPCRTTKEIPEGWIAVDIGPTTARLYAEEAQKAATIFWNGPMGIFEMDRFATGTQTVARGVAESTARSIVGGGDSLAAINQLGLGECIGHLSTGGGASLEYIQGRTLPGVDALDR